MRIDKWLWAARFFKTRTLASRACDLGRIQVNDQPIKPSREIRVGDFILIKNPSGDFHVEVLILSEMRGPAAVAQTLYKETNESRELRIKLAEERKAAMQAETVQERRPSKRDRRQIARFKGRD